MEAKPAGAMSGNMVDGQRLAGNGIPISTPARANHHPTVKPTDLMRYLCRLVTPPDGIVLDPFMGSGSTGKAAILEGFQFIGIDMTPEYVDIARARIGHAFKNKQNTLDL
jgi:site-specific DNA-methyltransferase (adenine-specific)